jgi:hypothetical protein
MKKKNLALAFVGILVIGLFVSCSGNGKAISMVRKGVLEINPSLTIDQALKQHPWRKGNIKWSVEEVVKQSKDEGGNLYLIRASFNHDTSDNAVFSDEDGIYRNDEKNAFVTDLLYYEYDEYNKSEDRRETTDERRKAVLNAYGELYYDMEYNEYGRMINSNDEFYITEEYFDIDSVQVNILFICAPYVEQFEVTSIIYEFNISTEILGKKDTFIASFPATILEYAIEDVLYEGQTAVQFSYGFRPRSPRLINEWVDFREEQMRNNRREKRASLEEEFNNRKTAALAVINEKIKYFEQFIPERKPIVNTYFNPSLPKPAPEDFFIESIQGAPTSLTVLIYDLNFEIGLLDRCKFEMEGDDKIKTSSVKSINYYVDTPLERIIPYEVSQYQGEQYNNYDLLSEAAGNYYKTPLSP